MKSGLIMKEILIQKGIKQTWVAERLGITDSTLNAKFNTELKVGDVIKICTLINLDLDEFFKIYKSKNSN